MYFTFSRTAMPWGQHSMLVKEVFPSQWVNDLVAKH